MHPIISSNHSGALSFKMQHVSALQYQAHPASLADLCAFNFSDIESEHFRVRYAVKLPCILVSKLTCTRLEGCTYV